MAALNCLIRFLSFAFASFLRTCAHNVVIVVKMLSMAVIAAMPIVTFGNSWCLMKSHSSMLKVVMNAKGGDADEDDHHPLPAQFLRLHPRLQKTD